MLLLAITCDATTTSAIYILSVLPTMAPTRRLKLNGQFCAAPNCNNSRRKCPEMVFHSFPVEERILDLLKKCVCKSKVIDTFPCENMRKNGQRIVSESFNETPVEYAREHLRIL